MNEEWFQLTRAAFLEGHAALKAALDQDKYILSYNAYPEISWLDTGFPSLTRNQFTKVVDYKKAFSPKPGSYSGPVIYNDLPAFVALQEHAVNSSHLSKVFSSPYIKDRYPSDLTRIAAALFVETLIDRFMHLHQNADPTEDKLIEIYSPLERPLFADDLYFDILVPIVLTHFDASDPVRLSDDVSLRKLTQDEQLARCPLGGPLTTPVNEVVLSAATHAFCVHSHSVKAAEWNARHSDEVFEPLFDRIDHVFDNFRAATGIRTGYAHFVLAPDAWADTYIGDLPVFIQGPRVRNYPESFERWAWLRPAPVVGSEELATVAEMLEASASAKRQFRLALGRYNQALLRADPEDALIDHCIALEALFGDSTKTEMTHKIALRAASAICQTHTDISADTVFRSIKQIYAYRSALVHGSSPSTKLTQVKLGDATFPTVEVARYFSGKALGACAKRPDLQDPSALDGMILKRLEADPPQ